LNAIIVYILVKNQNLVEDVETQQQKGYSSDKFVKLNLKSHQSNPSNSQLPFVVLHLNWQAQLY
jgi:hypothetical protein